jgi:hypothetical protein
VAVGRLGATGGDRLRQDGQARRARGRRQDLDVWLGRWPLQLITKRSPVRVLDRPSAGIQGIAGFAQYLDLIVSGSARSGCCMGRTCLVGRRGDVDHLVQSQTGVGYVVEAETRQLGDRHLVCAGNRHARPEGRAERRARTPARIDNSRRANCRESTGLRAIVFRKTRWRGRCYARPSRSCGVSVVWPEQGRVPKQSCRATP